MAYMDEGRDTARGTGKTLQRMFGGEFGALGDERVAW